MIVLHDTFNGEVRAGITDVDFAAYPAVALVELDMTGGYMARTGPFAGQLWGGIGLVVVDPDAERRTGLYNQYLYDSWSMVARARRRTGPRRRRRAVLAALAALNDAARRSEEVRVLPDGRVSALNGIG